ncbi:MAG: Hsp20/alpha crystallin family protein [Bacteroidota bacterium]
MKKDDFKIEVKGKTIYIGAETKNEKEKKENYYTRKEFNFSSFSRSFWLPQNVQPDDIKADYTEGILLVTLPKKDQSSLAN